MNNYILSDLSSDKEKVGELQTVMGDVWHVLEQAHKEISELRQELEGKNYELEQVQMELAVLREG